MDRSEALRLQPGRIASFSYNALLSCSWFCRFPLLAKLWEIAWIRSCRVFSGPVRTRIHGRKALVNYGHTYPLTSRRYRTFNNPVVELVFQSYSLKKQPITLVDVGANVGDTILLLKANCPGMLDDFVCVDADPEFFSYLENNLRGLGRGKLFLSLLSAVSGSERSLVRSHRGTSSSRGEQRVSSTTLDSILDDAGVRQVDVVKTDVDGLDGRVLLGAKKMLQRHRPAVIFEWHPLMCRATSSNWTDHFDVLEQCGYEQFVWYTKYGDFSHYSGRGERAGMEMLAELCLSSTFYDDWHYDVIALPPGYGSRQLPLAEMAYARSRVSSH